METEDMEVFFNVVIPETKLVHNVKDITKLDALINIAGNLVEVPRKLFNITEFDVLQQFFFSVKPPELRKSLATKGIELSLRYEKLSLGTAVISLPDTFIDHIGYKMNDQFHDVTVPIIHPRDDEVIGTLSLRLVLRPKCGEFSIIERRTSRKSFRKFRDSRASLRSALMGHQQKVEKEECFGLGPEFNPPDVLFVVGDPDPTLKIPAEPCSDLPSEEGDERLMLDLQRYRSLNQRVTFSTDDPCPWQKPLLSQLKKLTEKYGRIIDSVTERVRPVGGTATESPSENTVVTAGTPQEVGTERWIPVPMESEEEYGVKPIRYCPVCLYPMSWLPRFTPCPNCNTRPRSVLKVESEEKQINAKDIVAEQLNKPKPGEDFCLPEYKPMVNTDSDAECPPCRCTCKDGNICAHCRIRNLCTEIFNSDDEAKKQAEQQAEQRLARYPQPCSSEDFALIPGPEDDDRPYLSRVFSEMKSLYALHDKRKIKAIQQRCMSQSLLTLRSASTSLYQSQHHRLIAHARESYYRQKAGHKDCVPPDSLVPRCHGWDWHRSLEARKYGWRPGAILRAAVHVMSFFLTSEEERNPCNQVLAESEALQEQNTPVLNICKRNGDIFVTLRPLANSGNKQKPITFRIVKSHLAVALRQIKRALKNQGFEKCVCHKSLMLCTCRNALEKLELNKALRRECQRRLIKPCPEHLVLTDTSVSDLEFNLDVHSPSKSCKSRIKAIRKSKNHGTQTSKTDPLPPPPQYPMPVSPYYQAYDCAVGDRYMGTAFGLPGENVFEDGVFGVEGGGPHGPNPIICGRTKRGAGGGGRGRAHVPPSGPGTGPWQGFPRKADKGKVGNSGPIPVRYPKRFLKPAQDAAKAAKQAEIDAAEKKKKGPDMLKYLQMKGTLVRPWNPVDGKDKRPRPPKRTKNPEN